MREMLFRGKNVDGSGWVTDSQTYIRDADGVWLSDGAADVVKVIPETVGQFTGLTDKDGVRIFEGDVVEFYWNREPTNGNIIFLHGSFKVDSEFTVMVLNNIAERCEVIGNIHENPELMEGSQSNDRQIADAKNGEGHKERFTQGPWEIIDNDDCDGDTIIIASVMCDDDDMFIRAKDVGGYDENANAALIAAAPEMYTLLGEALTVFKCLGCKYCGERRPLKTERSIVAVLKKARGEG